MEQKCLCNLRGCLNRCTSNVDSYDDTNLILSSSWTKSRLVSVFNAGLLRGDGMHGSTVCDSDRKSNAPKKADQKEDANVADNK